MRYQYLKKYSIRLLLKIKNLGYRVPIWDLAAVLNITLVDQDVEHHFPMESETGVGHQEIRCWNGYIHYTDV